MPPQFISKGDRAERGLIRLLPVIFYCTMILFFIVILLTIPASAQETTSNESPVSELNETESDCIERVTDNLSLCDYSASDGIATITMQVNSSIYVTIADAAAFINGGRVHTQTHRLEPGLHEVRVPVTEADGMVGVSISTEDTLYAVPIERDMWLISGPWDSTDAQVSGLAGLVSGLLLVSALAYRKVNSRSDDPERLL